ncbi:MAG: O-antigen ligase family protein [Halioglobus sp.]
MPPSARHDDSPRTPLASTVPHRRNSATLMGQGIHKLQALLRSKGMAYCYAVFIAGYFLLPMVSGHRRLYYILVLPAALVLWRELITLYRGNTLLYSLLAFICYMIGSLVWSADFNQAEALWSIWYSFAVLTFCAVTGYLWLEHPQTMDKFLRRGLYVAAAAGLVSILAWYLNNPFPSSRLELLGVMSQTNNAACVYGLFTVLACHYFFTTPTKQAKLSYIVTAAILLSVVLLTQSRTALAATSLGILAIVGYRALWVPAIALGLNWALMAANSTLWTDRVTTFSFRPGIWRQTIADMQGHWLLGRGSLVDPEVSAYEQVFNHAHNGYLATLRDGGLIGITLLIIVLGLAAFKGLQLYRHAQERIYLSLLLYGMTCIAMDFDRLLVHPNELWLFFWAPIALIMTAKPQQREADEALRYALSAK